MQFIEGLTTKRIIAITVVAIALIIFFGIAHGKPSLGFDERRPGTWFSVALLLLSAAASFGIHATRKPQTDGTLRDPAHVWWLIGAGFIFLALDDAFRIHERMDKVLHWIVGLTETSVTDRIDDVIILAYGLIGIAVLHAYQREIYRVPGFFRLLLAGFTLFGVMVMLDVITNGKEYIALLNIPETAAWTVQQWTKVAEEAAKLLATSMFLAGFCHVLRHDKEESRR